MSLRFAEPTTSYVNNRHSGNNALYYWLFISLIIFCVVMAPYFILQHKLSFYFKKTIFTKLATSMNAKNIGFRGQSVKLNLSQNLFTQLAATNGKAMKWVNNSFVAYKTRRGDENKIFSIKITSTDHMSWEFNNVKADFYEAVILFDASRKRKSGYKTAFEKELFDGIVILVENIFTEPWKPTVFETERVFTGKEKNRTIHKQNFLIRFYNYLVFRTRATEKVAAYDNSFIDQYIEPGKLKIQTQSLFQYVFCDQKNLYLLLKTELDGTSFDLNMNIPVKDSMELFSQDLSLVATAMGEIQRILQFIEDNNIKYGKDVA
jgi:hypothetical protein